jgi:hypothetical protein
MHSKIRTLLFLGFTAVAATSLSGCIIESSSNSDTCAPSRYITLSWRIFKEATGAELSCAQAAVSTVTMNVDSVRFDFPCVDPGTGLQAGRTTSVPAGPHTVSLDMFDVAGQNVSRFPAFNTTVPTCSAIDLGPLEFDVL